jgi:hypothetical protein
MEPRASTCLMRLGVASAAGLCQYFGNSTNHVSAFRAERMDDSQGVKRSFYIHS